MRNSITLIPGGGLANRLRAIDSAYQLSLEHNKKLEVIWLKNRDLACSFEELFIPSTKFRVKKFTYLNFFAYPVYLQNKIPFGNLISRNDQKIRFDKVILNTEMHKTLYVRKEEVHIENNYENLFIDTCERFRKKNRLSDLFVPSKSINQRVKGVTAGFNEHTIGIHIRRTDNTISIQESPLELFEDLIKQKIMLNANSNFFLATDSEEVKNILKKKFSKHIHTVDHSLERNSKEGIKNGLVDFLCLSRTNKIVGSSGSSFTSEAAKFGSIPFEVLKSEPVT